MDIQEESAWELHPGEIELAKQRWSFIQGGSNLLSAEQERKEFMEQYTGCRKIIEYAEGTQQRNIISDRTKLF